MLSFVLGFPLVFLVRNDGKAVPHIPQDLLDIWLNWTQHQSIKDPTMNRINKITFYTRDAKKWTSIKQYSKRLKTMLENLHIKRPANVRRLWSCAVLMINGTSDSDHRLCLCLRSTSVSFERIYATWKSIDAFLQFALQFLWLLKNCSPFLPISAILACAPFAPMCNGWTKREHDTRHAQCDV